MPSKWKERVSVIPFVPFLGIGFVVEGGDADL